MTGAKRGNLRTGRLTCVHVVVYTGIMKNITFSAQEDAIERARMAAREQNRTLNELFREWLEHVSHKVEENKSSSKLEGLWKKTNYLRVGRKLSRQEMNER